MSYEGMENKFDTQTLADLPDDIDVLQAEFIKEGGNPNLHNLQHGELKARQKAHFQLAAEKKRHDQERGRFSRWASITVRSGLELVAVLFTILLVLVGLFLGTLLLIAAEITAVEKGFQTLDSDLAALYSIAIVFFFIVTLFIREVIAKDAKPEPEVRLSLRHVVNWLIYFLGLRRTWQPIFKQQPSLLARVDRAVLWLMWTIVVFGLLGRLDSKLGQIAGNWRSGIHQIIATATLKDMLVYVGSLVMTVALLLATHYVVYFVHQVYVQVTGGFDASFFVEFERSWSPELLAERQAANFWKIELLKLRNRNRLQPPPMETTT